jgi:hypothetical protein
MNSLEEKPNTLYFESKKPAGFTCACCPDKVNREIVSSASCASLACGYENIALRAAVLRDCFERRFLKQ